MRHILILVTAGCLIWFFCDREHDSSPLAIAETPSSSSEMSTDHQKTTVPLHKVGGSRGDLRNEAATDSQSVSTSKTRQSPSAADPRELPPLPTTHEDAVPIRVLSDHFSSHPSTERRIWNLRHLGAIERGEAAPDSVPPSEQPADIVDEAIIMKNHAAAFGSKVFSSFVGPLSVREEWVIGKQYHDEISSQIVVDEEASRRITKLAQPLIAKLRRTKGQPFTFTVVKNDEVNAIANIGGHVYVYQGLLELVTSDHELQFVLAHEIAHVELEHCSMAVLPSVIAERNLGKAAKLPANLMHKLLSLSYSPEDELDSDRWAYRTLRKLDFSEQQISDFFYRLLQYEQELKKLRS